MEVSAEINALSHDVIGAAMEVHRALGPGFLESVYEEALALEFEAREIPYRRQLAVPITYKGQKVGISRIDFLVAAQLVVELKALEAITPIHKAQVLSYLRALRLPLGLLLNFNSETLRDGIKRVILPNL